MMLQNKRHVLLEFVLSGKCQMQIRNNADKGDFSESSETSLKLESILQNDLNLLQSFLQNVYIKIKYENCNQMNSGNI